MPEDWRKTLSEKTGRPMPEEKRTQEKTHPHKSGSHKAHHNPGNRRNEEPPPRWLPLYGSLSRKAAKSFLTEKNELTTANTGLLFNKFCDVWSGPEKGWKPKNPKNKKAVKQQFFDEIVKQFNNNTEAANLLGQYNDRRKSLIEKSSLRGKVETYTTSWRFVSGLGMEHVLETGFAWHRILGVPYLPGSSVKGMIRAWAEIDAGKDKNKEEVVRRLFGPRCKDPEEQPDTGSLIVFDAIPSEKPVLEVDIMNPHYGKYYQGDGPPADYLNPTPIFFLTVAANVSFEFALAPRIKNSDSDDLKEGFNFLKEALKHIGAGAKTAVGYGYFE